MMLADGLFMTGVVVKAAASGSAAPTPAWTSHTVDDDAAAVRRGAVQGFGPTRLS